MKRIRSIRREDVLFFNTHFVYFLEKGRVFRGRRKASGRGGKGGARGMESRKRFLKIYSKTVRRVKRVWSNSVPERYQRILERFGVRTEVK